MCVSDMRHLGAKDIYVLKYANKYLVTFCKTVCLVPIQSNDI